MKLQKGANSGSSPTLQKAKSVIDENASEKLFGQAFDIIFKELERYMTSLKHFKGADWSVYVRMRNQERKDEASHKGIHEYDGPLLDEIVDEAAEEEKKKAAEKEKELKEQEKEKAEAEASKDGAGAKDSENKD
jgi:hypothetical protein